MPPRSRRNLKDTLIHTPLYKTQQPQAITKEKFSTRTHHSSVPELLSADALQDPATNVLIY